jgi:hypothetical protein
VVALRDAKPNHLVREQCGDRLVVYDHLQRHQRAHDIVAALNDEFAVTHRR